MKIHLRLFGELKGHLPPSGPLLELSEGTTGVQLILALGIPYGGEEGQLVLSVNDVEADHNAVLRDGDTVSLFAPLAGG